jgi:hypothetical protein
VDETRGIAGWNLSSNKRNFTDGVICRRNRHQQTCNLRFLDGRVQNYRWKAPKKGRAMGVKIQPGGDRDDFNRLIAGHPRTR